MQYVRYCVLMSLFLQSHLAFAQVSNPKNYKPLESPNQAEKTSIVTINNQYNSILSRLPDEYRDKYRDLYKSMQKEKVAEIEHHTYHFNETFVTFFDKLLAEIKQANPSLSMDAIKFFVSRDYAPNAHASLDGTVVFNLSLLAHCENESQVAFVICHELAHNQLKHPNKSIKKMFDAMYSEKGKAEIKAIAKSEYNSYEKAEAYLKGVVFKSRRHTRDNEAEADSMALQYLLNTRFDATQSSKCLLMLDKIDSLMFTPNFDLSKVFDAPNYRFKKSWIAEEETMFGKGKRVFDSQWEKDSLKTHPACQVRAATTTAMLASYAKANKKENPLMADAFADIALKAEFETLIAAYDMDQVDYCLFQTLQSLQKNPNNIFLHALIGQCFNALYEAQKSHTFSKIVAIPSNTKPKNYLPFLRFLNNMNLNDIGMVGFQYLSKLDKAYWSDELMLYTFATAARNAGQTEVLNDLKAQYAKSFENGKFKGIISKY